jgi:uncharacterized protein (DUF2141 family)
LEKKERMKTKTQFAFATILWILSPVMLLAQHDLEVTVKNVGEKTGNIRVGLFTNNEDFLKKAKEGKVVKASTDEVIVVFTNLTSGEYAVSVIHDQNNNGELDYGFMRIPKEPYGFSNDATGNFGPPSFEKAKLQVTGNTKSVINLR